MSTTGSARSGNKIAYAVIGVFVALCAIGWAIVMSHVGATPGIAPQVISWRTSDRSVRVHYQVGKPKGEVVRCSLVAYDTGNAEVGRMDITVPSGTSTVEARQDLATSARATAVTVKDCRAG